MTVASDLDLIYAAQRARAGEINARRALEECTIALDTCNSVIQRLDDAGDFNTIRGDLQAALNAWWTIVKTARTDIAADTGIQEALDWRPS